MAEVKNVPSLKLPNVTNVTPLLVVILIAAAFVIGVLWTKVQYLEGRGSGPGVAGTTTGGTTAGTQGTQAAQPAQPTVGNIRPVDDNDHIRGNKNAKVTLVEYSDLECPFCKRFHPTMQQAMQEYQGKIRWVYRHFPLDQIHSKADKEAEATECAAEQGGNDAFWKMADKIFEVTPSNNGLNLDDLPKLAGDIGLDGGKLKSCLDSGKYASAVEEDYQDGIKGGITGTPGTLVIDAKGNKKLIPGALPYESVKQEIEAALKS